MLASRMLARSAKAAFAAHSHHASVSLPNKIVLIADAYELEPPDSSGRFASAVEPWLAAHSQKQPDHSGKKPMKGGDAVNGGHGRARAYTHGAKGAGASAAATAAAVEYVATEKVSEHSKSTEGVLQCNLQLQHLSPAEICARDGDLPSRGLWYVTMTTDLV